MRKIAFCLCVSWLGASAAIAGDTRAELAKKLEAATFAYYASVYGEEGYGVTQAVIDETVIRALAPLSLKPSETDCARKILTSAENLTNGLELPRILNELRANAEYQADALKQGSLVSNPNATYRQIERAGEETQYPFAHDIPTLTSLLSSGHLKIRRIAAAVNRCIP